MHGPMNVKSPINISEWQMGFNSAFKRLKEIVQLLAIKYQIIYSLVFLCCFEALVEVFTEFSRN